MPSFESAVADAVFMPARIGQRGVCRHLVELLVKKGGWGFNFLHLEALGAPAAQGGAEGGGASRGDANAFAFSKPFKKV